MSDFPFSIVGFDLDGTLLDTHVDLGNAVNHALSLIGRSAYPLQGMRALIGGGAKKMLSRALNETGGQVAEPEFERLYQELLRHYEGHMADHTRLFPGGEAMLDGLAARSVQVAVVTNKIEAYARQLLEQLGLAQRFFTIIGGDTMGPGRAKPAPDQLYEMIARADSVGPAVYVGDTTYDIRGARAADLPCVAVSFGFNDLHPQDLGADRVIDHFDQLIPTLMDLGG